MTTLENRPNTALLVVDVQNGVVAGGHERDAVVANVASLVESWRQTLAARNVAFEIVLVDDGSSDRTAELAGLLPEVKLLRHEKPRGIGAALMTPAALSILTTSFNVGTDRVKALGAWGAMGGFSGVLGVFLGGVITAGPGWRWVLYINVPICAVVIIAAYLLVSGEAPRRSGLASFDTPFNAPCTKMRRPAPLPAVWMVTSTRSWRGKALPTNCQ